MPSSCVCRARRNRPHIYGRINARGLNRRTAVFARSELHGHRLWEDGRFLQEEIDSMGWWPFGKSEQAPLTAEERAALTALVSNPKYELIPLKKVRETAEALPPGARVTVTA